MSPVKQPCLSMMALVCAAALQAQHAVVEQFPLADFSAEQSSRWSDRVSVIQDAAMGAVGRWEVPALAKAHASTLSLGDWTPECDEWDELRFEYKLSEVPVWFGVKVTDYPLADGMQATWQLEVPRHAAGQWQQASVRLHEPRWLWGDKPSRERRAVDFRMQNNAEHEVEVCIARPRLVRSKVRLAGAPELTWEASGRRGRLAFTVVNRSQDSLALQLRLSASDKRIMLAPAAADLSLAPGQQQEINAGLSCREAIEPLTLFQVELASLAPGAPAAQSEAPDDDLLAVRETLEVTTPFGEIPVPCLLFTSKQLPALRARVAPDGVAHRWWQSLQKKADEWLERKPEYPPRGAQWWHWYSCKTCGVGLKTASPTSHVCPQCKTEYSGWPYDDVVLSRDHDELANSVRDLGIVYQVTGDRRYAEKAHEILHGYAERYLNYPLHNIHGKPNKGGGRVHPQTLDEAIWLISMAQGFDAIKDILSAAEIEFLAGKMLVPAAEMIKDHQWGIHNICCWHASAYGLVGITLGDQQLLGAAINGPMGFRAQVDKGVTVDGPWYEGAWGYHFYTMSALEPLAIAANNLGINVHSQRYKGMYDAPLKFLAPSYQLPAFHDSGRVGFSPRGASARYETAYSWWNDPLHGWVAAGGNRQNMYAALWGSDEIDAGRVEFKSGAYDAAGVVVMRSQSPLVPAGDIPGNFIALDYGEHGGGHGHPDKLNIVIWGRGELLAEDPGCIAYGNPAHQGWYRQTLSHNTLVVDGVSQREATGKLLAFASAGNATLCSVTAGTIYSGVEAGRVLALVDDMILDMLWARSDKEHQYEWCFHSRGVLALDAAGEAAEAPEGDGYKWVPAWRRRGHDGAWRAEWQHNDVVLRLWQRSAAGELWDGVGMGNPPTVKPPLVFNRVRAPEALFASVMVIAGKDETPLAGEILDQGMDAAGNCRLRARCADKLYLLLASQSGDLRYGDLSLKGQVALLVGDDAAGAAPTWQTILVK